MHTFSVTPVRDVDCLARTHELLAKQKYSTFSNIKCNDQSVLSDVLHPVVTLPLGRGLLYYMYG